MRALQPVGPNIYQAEMPDLSSTAGWLTQREALINIAPRKTNARAIVMSDADLQNLLFRIVVLLPLAAFIAGFGVWWSRRS